MRLATIRTTVGTAAVRVDRDTAIEVDGAPDVGALLADPRWRARAATADGPRHPVGGLDYAPVVPRPGKIVCVGLNYRTHIQEMGRALPAHPTLFAKFAEALIGPYDDLVLPAESEAVDWEAELAVVIGRPVRRADPEEASAAIAGYAVINDVTMRDWQYRTTEWLQGKTFEATTPFGPHLVTTDEVAPDALIVCEVDGEVVQASRISDLVFGPVELVSYISTILTLSPGDVIVTGTTGGVGHARSPKRYLHGGQQLVTRIYGVGELVNTVRAPAVAR
ncbi:MULTISPECIES: fumarylacetoacetate hydrolase family protein [unclassified Crossiella]|uniref:fumarylacetoacetate hydrolase family protein n=1 Tax=unclassified Crossiella TaxID=2620835 RepID=UPI001FFF7465|nr:MULTISPECIES: fumarylacetoacetate hydrolase family protein [unclassified Crossiella]MCK2244633.1 fumarylacetoacetate hydrolase family protein [Crossiella sp. S99.2]MCK2258380.1 fumarylacetoacetate hydrolase family protein [Crossiella sp. S99.1]